MTSWRGVLQGLMSYEEAKNAREDRAFEREKFERALLEQRRGPLLEQLREARQARAQRVERIRTGVNIGLSTETATALERSGQLSLFLSAYDESEGVDPQYISALDEVVRTELAERGANDDTVSAAILSGTTTTRDVSDPDQSLAAITEAILTAQNFEELEAAQGSLFDLSVTPTGVSRFDIDTGRMTGLEEAETRSIRREIAETLSPYFEDAFEITSDGDVIISQSAPAEVAQLFNEAERSARRLATGPQRQFTPTDAANYVSTRIENAATGVEQIDAADMATNFDLILTDPNAYVEQFTPIIPGNGGDGDDDEEDPAGAVDSLGGWTSGIIDRIYGN